MAAPSRKKKAITLETKYELFEVYKRGDSQERHRKQIRTSTKHFLKVQF